MVHNKQALKKLYYNFFYKKNEVPVIILFNDFMFNVTIQIFWDEAFGTSSHFHLIIYDSNLICFC